MHFIFQTVKFNVYFRKQLMKNHSLAFSPECSNNGKFFRKTLKEPVVCCLKITEKVSFNIASEECYFPSSEMDFTEEVDSCSGKSVSKGGLYPPRVGLAASSEARAVIETQGG